MTGNVDAKCARCGQALTPGSGYCLACGFNNDDLHAKKLGVEQQAEQRLERAKLFGRLARILRWTGLVR